MKPLKHMIIKTKRILQYKFLKLIENARGLDTLKYVNVEELGFSHVAGYRYEHTKKKCLREVLKKMNISEEDSIVDLGSGKGVALIEFARYPFKKIAGVELSNILLNICRNNLERLNIKNVELHCMNASGFKQFEEYNYIYMYNPFPEAVVKKVLSNLKATIEKSIKPIYIIYKYPTCHKAILDSGYFEDIMEFKNKNTVYPLADYIIVYRSLTECISY